MKDGRGFVRMYSSFAVVLGSRARSFAKREGERRAGDKTSAAEKEAKLEWIVWIAQARRGVCKDKGGGEELSPNPNL